LFSVSQVFFISFFIGREREKREREKKNWGRGENTFCLSKIPPKNKIRRKRRVLVFNPPRGARTFHTSKLYQSVSRQRIILILLIREHSDLI
jgi:hypothetical protein